MQGEVLAGLGRDADALEAGIDAGHAGRGGQLDHAQSADRLPDIAARGGEGGHDIGQAQRLPQRAVDGRRQAQGRGRARQHRTVHALGAAAAHLVPVVAGQLQLGAVGNLDLGQGHQVVEAGFARRLLGQEPLEVLQRGLAFQPVEQRVPLAGAVVLQRLEPGDEAVGVLRNLIDQRRHEVAEGLDERALDPAHADFLVQLFAPACRRLARRQADVVPVRQALVQGLGVGELRAERAQARKTFATVHGHTPRT